ncbi:MAG: c-type cytochrome [Hyphomicrobiales bacterium]
MSRKIFLLSASAAFLVVCGASLGVRADALSAIEARIQLMKIDGQAARLGLDMVKGTVPFDLAKAKGIFSTFIDAAQKEVTLFPEDSKTGDGTTAAPRIWEDMAAFQAAYGKFGKDSADALQSTTDLNSFKAAFGTVTKNCGSCHELYRVKKG